MIKRVMPLLIAIIMFFVTSCGSSTPPNAYASEMETVVEQLSKWQIQYQKFETLLTEPNASPGGMSRVEMIELYNMATAYQITRDDYASMGFMPLDILVGDANKFAREGHNLIDTLSAFRPDDEIQETHQVVLQCVQTRVAFAEEISSSIKNLEPIDLGGDSSPCATFEADLEKLTAYVTANQ